jgi:hypothetical protein
MKVTNNRAEEIRVLHGEILGSFKTSLVKAIRIGELLTEQKDSLEHGDFIPWVEKNLPFSDRTARNYMRLYRERDRLKTESVSDLTSAYFLLTEPKDGPVQIQDEKAEPWEVLHNAITLVLNELKDKIPACLDFDELEKWRRIVLRIAQSCNEGLITIAQIEGSLLIDTENDEQGKPLENKWMEYENDNLNRIQETYNFILENMADIEGCRTGIGKC